MMLEKTDDDKKLMQAVAEGIFEKKGERVIKLDMRLLQYSVCGFFILCHAQSNTQVESIAESVVRTVKNKISESPFHKEGFENCQWVLLDYGSVIVHIFKEEYRNLYNLEALWADAESETIEDKELKKETKTKKRK